MLERKCIQNIIHDGVFNLVMQYFIFCMLINTYCDTFKILSWWPFDIGYCDHHLYYFFSQRFNKTCWHIDSIVLCVMVSNTSMSLNDGNIIFKSKTYNLRHLRKICNWDQKQVQTTDESFSGSAQEIPGTPKTFTRDF